MTDGVSDDCSGPIVFQDYVWMQLSRKDDIFAVHYSLDGKTWHMTRLARLLLNKKLKVGFVSQSPTGDGTVVNFSEYSIEKKSLGDSREGI